MATANRFAFGMLTMLTCLAILGRSATAPTAYADEEPSWKDAAQHSVNAKFITPTVLNSHAAPGDTNAVHFTTTTNGYAVTSSGSILRSTDGGTNWDVIVHNQGGAYNWLRWNGSLAATVGTKWANNRLVVDMATSQDNGAHWQTTSIPWPNLNNGPTGELQAYPVSAGDVWLLPTSESAVAGMSTPIWHSSDNGKSWTTVGLPQHNTATGGIVANGDDIAITVQNSSSGRYEVLVSSNGGSSWTPLIAESDVPMYTLTWPSPHRLLIGGGNVAKFSIQPGEAILSVDPAVPNHWYRFTWIRGDNTVYQPIVDLEPATDGSLYALCGGISMGGNLPAPGRLLHISSNGHLLPMPSSRGGTSVSAVGQHIWLASEGMGGSALGGTGIAMSTDGGSIWISNIRTSDIAANAVQFLNAKVGFVSTQIGLLQTRDGGRTWHPIPLQNQYGPTPFWMNQNTAFVVTSNSLMKTTDCGRTWKSLKLPERTDEINCITTLSQGFLAVSYVPARSLTPITDNLAISNDYGNHWRVVSNPFDGDGQVSELSFVSAKVGYAYVLGTSPSTPSRIWKTTNGGRQWMPLDVSPLNCATVAMTTNSSGVVFSAGNGPLWSQSSNPLPNNVLAFLNNDGRKVVYKLGLTIPDSVSFVNQNNGWITTMNGNMYHTTDGGTTWTRVWLSIWL